MLGQIPALRDGRAISSIGFSQMRPPYSPLSRPLGDAAFLAVAEKRLGRSTREGLDQSLKRRTR